MANSNKLGNCGQGSYTAVQRPDGTWWEHKGDVLFEPENTTYFKPQGSSSSPWKFIWNPDDSCWTLEWIGKDNGCGKLLAPDGTVLFTAPRPKYVVNGVGINGIETQTQGGLTVTEKDGCFDISVCFAEDSPLFIDEDGCVDIRESHENQQVCVAEDSPLFFNEDGCLDVDFPDEDECGPGVDLPDAIDWEGCAEIECLLPPVDLQKKVLDVDNQTFELCVNVENVEGLTETFTIDIWSEVKQIVECCLAEKCPINGGTITYAEGPGVLVDNSAGFVLTDKDGVAQPTEYCVTDGNSGRDEKWIVHKEAGTVGGWQWHQQI